MADDNNYLDYADSYVELNLNKSFKNYKNFLVRMRKVKGQFPTTDNSGKLWELRISKDKVKRLGDSNLAAIGLTYPKLKGLKINRGILVSAFNQLAQMRPNTEISNDVVGLCLVLAEATRFNSFGTEFGNALRRVKEVIIDEWIVKLVKHWAYLLGIAALCKEKHVMLTDGENNT
ncbi:hypothetical protein Tco_1352792 [Tanacetum coccineum]